MIVPKGFELSPPQINANDIIEDTIEDIDDKEGAPQLDSLYCRHPNL